MIYCSTDFERERARVIGRAWEEEEVVVKDEKEEEEEERANGD